MVCYNNHLSTSYAPIPWHITIILLETKPFVMCLHFSFRWVPNGVKKVAHELVRTTKKS